jgi:glutamate racemase
MIGNQQPIGFFDSGVGGISVLIEAILELPHESFIYLGDSLNAPYGVKTVLEVQALTLIAVQRLIDMGAKAVVIACNTATSASIKLLRETFSVPIIGMEPALKLAVDTHVQGDIMVLATPMTLKERKFEQLMARVGVSHTIVKMPAPELVIAIEQNQLEDATLYKIFDLYFKPYEDRRFDAVVLGCTHYIFIKEALSRYLSGPVRIIDGNAGTVRHLTKILKERQALSLSNAPGTCEVVMTGGAKSQAIAEGFLQRGLSHKED